MAIWQPARWQTNCSPSAPDRRLSPTSDANGDDASGDDDSSDDASSTL
jgi:hypothetical protein